MTHLPLWCGFAAGVLFCALGFSAASATEPGGLLSVAESLERDGMTQQAESKYSEIISADSNSPETDRARLGLARIAWPVDKVGLVGLPHPGDPTKAFRHLNELRKPHGKSGSETLAEGLWRLALLYLEPFTAQRNPEESAAILRELITLYPGSPLVPQALTLSASLALNEGRTAQARATAFQTLAEWPESPACGKAWLALAEAAFAENSWKEGLTYLGNVTRTPVIDPETAAVAKDLVALVIRLHLLEAPPTTPVLLTITERQVIDRRVVDMAFDREGRLYAAIEDRPMGVFSLSEGKHVRSELKELTDSVAVAVDGLGALWTATTEQIRPSGRTAFGCPEKCALSSMSPADDASVWVVDGKSRTALHLDAATAVEVKSKTAPHTDADRVPRRRFELSGSSDLHRVATRTGGSAWVLDAKARKLFLVKSDGVVITQAGMGDVEPLDLDVDSLGNVYVLEEGGPQPLIVVFSPSGKVLVRFSLPADKETGLRRPTAIAVNRTGTLAVFDSKRKEIAWLR
jgi:hypothetical protein